MNSLYEVLRAKERRGSKPRCHLVTHGAPEIVANRLTALVEPFASVGLRDDWMPQGFTNVQECQLHKASRLIDEPLRKQLEEWWLPPASARTMTPNFDIASTCTIAGKRGLVLIEAKAHDEELNKEGCGRRITECASEDRKKSHETIGKAIEGARDGLAFSTSLSWHISRDSHYQMSNRFAWCWKLAHLGVPVVLIYLGFLNAGEMADRGKPFSNAAEWEELVRLHSAPLFATGIWNRTWVINDVPFTPLIRSMNQLLD